VAILSMAATAQIRMKKDPYCVQKICISLSVSDDVRFLCSYSGKFPGEEHQQEMCEMHSCNAVSRCCAVLVSHV